MDGDKVESITLITGGDQYASAPTITIDAHDSVLQQQLLLWNQSIILSHLPQKRSVVFYDHVEENLNNDIGAGTTAYFHQLSRVVASSHTFEYIGSTQFNLLPPKEVV